MLGGAAPGRPHGRPRGARDSPRTGLVAGTGLEEARAGPGEALQQAWGGGGPLSATFATRMRVITGLGVGGQREWSLEGKIVANKSHRGTDPLSVSKRQGVSGSSRVWSRERARVSPHEFVSKKAVRDGTLRGWEVTGKTAGTLCW